MVGADIMGSNSVNHSVASSSLWPHGLKPARLLSPWNSPDKSTGVGGRSLLQGIFLTQGPHPGFLHCRQILYHLSHLKVEDILSPVCLLAWAAMTKYHWVAGLNSRNIFLTVLQAESPGSKYQQGWVLVRPLFLICRRYYLMSSHGRDRELSSCLFFFLKGH